MGYTEYDDSYKEESSINNEYYKEESTLLPHDTSTDKSR